MEEEEKGVDLTREVTVTVKGKPNRIVFERHTSSLYIMDMMMLMGESKVLAAAAALVLVQPRMAAAVKFKRDLATSAEKLYDHLEAKGWDIDAIMRAGMHAYAWLAPQVPVTASSPEVDEMVGFSEAGSGSGSGES
jgi:hypothetical protein